MGSGFGDEISISQSENELEIERILFHRRAIQPPFRYRFSLEGSKTENKVPTGRSWPVPISTTEWKDNRLVITTAYTFPHPKTKKWMTSQTIQTLWLEYAKRSPWEPALVIETTREGVLGGVTSTNRTTYVKGRY